MFVSLKELNIQSNRIISVHDDVIKRLVDPVSQRNTILEILYLNLTREEEVESILRSCTALVNLNGIEVDRNELLGQGNSQNEKQGANEFESKNLKDNEHGLKPK